MSKRTDLREIQRLTEDAAIDARKLLIQADNLPPDTFQKMLEALCGSFEDTALQLRRLCEQQSPGTGGYKRGRALRPLEVVGSVERIGIDWLHIRINTLLPHCRFQPPTWLTETLVELLDAYEACGGQLPHFNMIILKRMTSRCSEESSLKMSVIRKWRQNLELPCGQVKNALSEYGNELGKNFLIFNFDFMSAHRRHLHT